MEDGEEINEPNISYNTPKKITFFQSFEDAENYGRKQMALHTHAQRLANLEKLRKRIFSDKLLPNGSWPLLSKSFNLVKGSLT